MNEVFYDDEKLYRAIFPPEVRQFNVGAIVRYKPTTRSIFHTEIHSGENRVLLTASKARAIAKRVKVI